MAFDPISYTYVLTALYNKGTVSSRKTATKQCNVLNEKQYTNPESEVLEVPCLPVAVAADESKVDRSCV